MEDSVFLNNKTYELVKTQRDDISAIYKCGDEYLRLGETAKIKRDLEAHRKMEAEGFPVAEVLDEGELDGLYYFTETSLGAYKIGEIFADDTQKTGRISDENFDVFLSVVEKFMKAQLNAKSPTEDFNSFSLGILLDNLCNELPEYSAKIRARFAEIKDRLAVFPFVLTHGDFNPGNLYPAGVIDFEDTFYGPFGFDIVGALVYSDYMPDSSDYEYFAKYRFSAEQKKKYFELVDSTSQSAGLPKLSEFEKDFEFCKAVWLSVRMEKWPKLQKFRYDLLIDRFLK